MRLSGHETQPKPGPHPRRLALPLIPGAVGSRILYLVTLTTLGACGSGHTATGPSGSGLTVVSGDSQTGTFGAVLGSPVVVHVAPGTTVTWQPSTGSGSISAPATSDANGLVHATWTLGNTFFSQTVLVTAGNQSVTVRASGNGSGDLGGRQIFPADNAWNTDISSAPIDSNSSMLIASCGATSSLHPDFGTVYAGAPNGIPYVVVHGNEPQVPVSFQYASESDPGPYPVPPNASIEGGPNGAGDRHVLVLDADDWKLYEMWNATPVGGGASWTAGSGAIFDLTSDALRPAGWTSADAAGLAILPGLVRYDEVVIHGAITHALRFTCPSTRKGYIAPARHEASNDASSALPPMGMRVRLKASVSLVSFPPHVQVILRALQRYGMLVADNGSAFYLSGAPDPRWSDDELHTMTSLHGSDFEVVRMGPVTP